MLPQSQAQGLTPPTHRHHLDRPSQAHMAPPWAEPLPGTSITFAHQVGSSATPGVGLMNSIHVPQALHALPAHS